MNYIIALITSICGAISAIFSYKSKKLMDHSEEYKEKKKEIKDASNEVEKACDSGSLDDLLDATKKLGDTK